MEICAGITLSALQELGKQAHLNSSEKKRKKIEPDVHQPPWPMDEVNVEQSQVMAKKEQERIEKAQKALSDISPTRMEKLEQVCRRMNEGFYEQDEVVGVVADRLLKLFRSGILDKEIEREER